MISSKRQISTYRDHFGGYGEDARTVEPSLDALSTAAVADASASRDGIADRELTSPQYTTAAQVQTRTFIEPQNTDGLYSTVGNMSVAAEPEIAEPDTRTVEVPKREKRAKNRLYTDIEPSKKTQDSIKHAQEQTRAAAPARRSGGKIDPRTKVMLLVYVIIAAALAAAVIATGVSITHSSAQTQSLYDEIASIQTSISAQELEIADIAETMHERAEELGMVDAGDVSGTVGSLEKTDYPAAKPHTNGFDKFCKLLSGMFS